jgi:hypothetical protein
MCQNCGPYHNGRIKEWGGNHVNVTRFKEFFPSLFDIMSHLLIHLIEELKLCGLMHIQWMYLIEWYFKTLKSYVWNKAWLEGCMIESYSLEEALGFYIECLWDFTTTRQKVWDDKKDPSIFEGGGQPQVLTIDLLDMAHEFVLHNVTLMAIWCKYVSKPPKPICK